MIHETIGDTESVRHLTRGEDDLLDLMSGSDVGLALFDCALRVVRFNPLYQSLCGYTDKELFAGAPMAGLIETSLRAHGANESQVETAIATTMAAIGSGSEQRFRYRSIGGDVVQVCRRQLKSGRLVETVKPSRASPNNPDLYSQFERMAETARSHMMHALEVMADGFALYDTQDRLVVYNQRYIDFNPHIADLIMPGASFESMLREGVRRGGFNTHGMDIEEFVAWRMDQHRNPGEPVETELSDGRWIQVQEQRTDDGQIVGIRSDITAFKQREFDNHQISDRLKATALQFETALNNMIQGLCMFDADQTLLVCNKKYLDMYGFSAEVVKPGIPLRKIMEYSVSLGNYTEEEAATALAERPDPRRLANRTTIKQRLRDGRVIAVMNEPMKNGGSIATYQDVTELENHAIRQKQYTKQLERSNRELEDFAYVASHDLQEPLRKIETFGDRLRSKYGGILPEDGQLYVDRMQDAAGRMRRLITDLLSYSRVTTKAEPFAIFDFAKMLSGVLSDLQIRIEETGAQVRVGTLPEPEADESQMRQLMQNLIGNALKFQRPEVPPVVEVDSRTFTQEDDSGVEKAWCEITVADNGIGFENQYKDQIFTIFQRLHGRLEYEGTGVGLATCRKIVERHGGKIDADGRPGEGATFIVQLPLEQEDSKEIA